MERGSTQHGARLDDELSREAEPLTRAPPIDDRSEEARSSDAPDDALFTPPDQELTGDMSTRDVRERSEFARHLAPRILPATTVELIESAEAARAPDQVLEMLSRLPADRHYENIQDVWSALGRHVERHA